MIVYLLHFNKLVSGKQHYIGCTYNLLRRLEQHRNYEYASKLCKEAVKNNISFTLGKTWNGGYKLEQKIKRDGHAERYCIICNPPLTDKGFNPL